MLPPPSLALARVLADAHIAHPSGAFPPAAEIDRLAQESSERADAAANAKKTCALAQKALELAPLNRFKCLMGYR